MADAKPQATRPYAVFEGGNLAALIRTTSAARAIAHHTEGKYEAHVADADELFNAAKQGLEIKDGPGVAQPGLLSQ